MRLKLERFEGLASFSIRGPVTQKEIKILQVGLDSLIHDLHEPLVINLSIAEIPTEFVPVLAQMKKHVASIAEDKISWVSSIKAIADFPNISLFASRLPGSKSRVIGERLQLEDEVYLAQEKIKTIEARILELGGEGDSSQKIILENLMLKEQERILRETVAWQTNRMKIQAPVPTEDKDIDIKIKAALTEVNKIYGQELDL